MRTNRVSTSTPIETAVPTSVSETEGSWASAANVAASTTPAAVRRQGAGGPCAAHPELEIRYRRVNGDCQHRQVRGIIKTVSVKREGSRWYVILSCDNVPADTLPG